MQCAAKHTPNGPRVAVVGVTGAVGREFLRVRLSSLSCHQLLADKPPALCVAIVQVMEERNFEYSSVKLLASARSAGSEIPFDGASIPAQELTESSFNDVDLALFSAGGGISKHYAPLASSQGCTVVDNSSAFRMADGVPLVIPEVNGSILSGIHAGSKHIIANPNCSTIIALMAATPLHRVSPIQRMVISTYQSASGAGQAAMNELEQQTRDVLSDRPPTQNIFPDQYAFNVFSHNSDVGDNGYNEEEMKMVKETHKILGDHSIRVTATCIRVPVMRAHAESINVQFKETLSENEARQALCDSAPGIEVIDNRTENVFPTPLASTHRDPVLVGRIRQDISQDTGKGLDMFVCGDQVKKGAAMNTVQIAELLV